MGKTIWLLSNASWKLIMDNTIWLFILLILSQGCDGQLRNGTQTEASETCNKTLASPEELQIYKNKSPYPGSLWLSLKKSEDSRWTWLDGTNLQKNVSQHPTPNHDCGLIRTADGILDESACFSRRYGFICTIKEGNECPSTCHEMVGTKVVVEHTENYTWFQARDNCRKRNNDLAVFPNKDRTLVISEARRLFGTGHFWIGLRKNPWRFADNSEPMFYNWEPSTAASDKKCAVIGKNGWRTASCSDTHQFVCSGDPILTQTGGTTAEISITPDQRQTTERVGNIDFTDFPTSGSSISKSRSNKGLVIGVTVFVLLLVLLLCAGVLLFLYFRHREALIRMTCGFIKAKQSEKQTPPEEGGLLKGAQGVPGGAPQCELKESESKPVTHGEESHNASGSEVDEICVKMEEVLKPDVRNATNKTDDQKAGNKVQQQNTKNHQHRAPVTPVWNITDQAYRQQQTGGESDHEEEKGDEEDEDNTKHDVQQTIQVENPNRPFLAPSKLDHVASSGGKTAVK